MRRPDILRRVGNSIQYGLPMLALTSLLTFTPDRPVNAQDTDNAQSTSETTTSAPDAVDAAAYYQYLPLIEKEGKHEAVQPVKIEVADTNSLFSTLSNLSTIKEQNPGKEIHIVLKNGEYKLGDEWTGFAVNPRFMNKFDDSRYLVDAAIRLMDGVHLMGETENANAVKIIYDSKFELGVFAEGISGNTSINNLTLIRRGDNLPYQSHETLEHRRALVHVQGNYQTAGTLSIDNVSMADESSFATGQPTISGIQVKDMSSAAISNSFINNPTWDGVRSDSARLHVSDTTIQRDQLDRSREAGGAISMIQSGIGGEAKLTVVGNTITGFIKGVAIFDQSPDVQTNKSILIILNTTFKRATTAHLSQVGPMYWLARSPGRGGETTFNNVELTQGTTHWVVQYESAELPNFTNHLLQFADSTIWVNRDPVRFPGSTEHYIFPPSFSGYNVVDGKIVFASQADIVSGEREFLENKNFEVSVAQGQQ